ncbi:hypothetical protein L2088_26500 [Pseudomonas protegens]|uniref:Fap system outer membrane protein n=1 Tax=Pseudomonas protegens TaxID=380021 RepID=A0A9Q6IBB3_9PSED|nr:MULTISPECIES: hypothetical protein [Pseudomonas]MCL9658270.1 hypothetical protein [Pseudomonas protegens]MDP4572778.1 hypothetical protein [Pseudomonas sp. LPH60]MDP9505292.1 hypothetical protein [Pseudomonas protegens]PNG31842.1 hypothetical protein A1348_18080 [Pseudomonas protegens]PYC31251.1 hypothetical protein DMX08_25155 [Pseudomonas protegens]
MKTSYWLAAACLAAALPAHAGFKPELIQDQELSQLRGRYVMPGRIISFGIVMSSTWRNASGDLIGATTSLQIQQATIKPEFYVSTITQTGDGTTPPPGTGNVIGGAGLASGQGVTQSVRAAGDGNSAYNNISINVTEANQAPALAAGAGQALMSGQTITGSNAAGSVAVSALNGGIQMAIQANGNQGSALQQVAQGNLLQNTQLMGNSNLVNNLTQLNVVLRNNGPSNGVLDCNLTTLDALRKF